MSRHTFASLCTGGGAADLGARAAGLESLWGIEWDDRIANVARANGVPVVTADVCTARPSDFEPPDVLHASPPCPNFSQANTGGKETAEDVSIAQGVARFVDVLRPRAFTLENVTKYAYSESWRVIEATLKECGYIYDVHGGKKSRQLCAADFSVPQTRRRFWVRAVSSVFLPPLPEPTPWQGWYSAVDDLLPSCPESPLANWQQERLKDHPVVGPLLVGNSKTQWGDGTRRAGEPAFAVTSQSKGRVRAVLIGGQNANQEWGTGTRDEHQPAMTVTPRLKPRAVLIGDQYEWGSDNDERSPQNVPGDQPAFTVPGRRRGDWRAVLVSSNSIDGGAPALRDAREPALTVDTKTPVHVRAITEYRTVAMSLACMARFQGMPDDYAWTDDAQLNALVNGNAVPPEQYRRLVAGLVRGW